jgi:hypothetical protein
MSFRSGINQVNKSNSSPIVQYTNTVANLTNGGRMSLPITLAPGTYSCALNYNFAVTGTGSISLSVIDFGLSSSNTTSVAIDPLPLSATRSLEYFSVGPTPAVIINAGTGFTDFKETYISLTAPTTIYLYGVAGFINTGTPFTTLTQNVTITKIRG